MWLLINTFSLSLTPVSPVSPVSFDCTGAAWPGRAECEHGGQRGRGEHEVRGEARQTAVLARLRLPEGRGVCDFIDWS